MSFFGINFLFFPFHSPSYLNSGEDTNEESYNNSAGCSGIVGISGFYGS